MVSPSFDWSQFQQTSPKNTQAGKETSSTPEKSYSWGEFQTPSTYQGKSEPTEGESIVGWLARNTVSHLSRASERILGGYGDIEKLARKGLSKAPETMGFLGKAIHDLVGKDNWEKIVTGEAGGQFFPTSQEIEAGTHKLTKEYTKPKTSGEKSSQEIIGDIASLRTGGRSFTGARTLFNKVGIPVAANAAKESVEGLGYGEKAGEWTKLATWLSLSLAERSNANRFAANLMNEGRNGFGPNVVANVPRYQNSINGVARNMMQGDPRSNLAQQQIAGINNDIAQGQTSMRDLMTRYDAINAAKRDRGLFELNRADRRAAIRNIDQVRDAVRNEIQTLGRANPQALESWQNGVNAFAVIHRSNTISNFAMNQLKKAHNGAFAAAIFGAGAFKAPLTTTIGAPALPLAHKTGQILYRIWSDPNLARYYWESLRAASLENAPAFAKSYSALEKAYEKKYGRYASAQ